MRPFSSIGAVLGEVRRARKLCADWGSFWRLASDLVGYRVMRFARLLQTDRLREIHIEGGGVLCYRRNRGDIWTVNEVMLRECYALPFLVAPGLMVDLGTNVGLTSVWFARRHGMRRVVGVEPAASNRIVAERNFELNEMDAVLVAAAIGSCDGMALFREYSHASFNELVIDGAGPREAPGLSVRSETEVSLRSMDSVLAEAAVDPDVRISLLKMDIEGGEQDLLTGDCEWLGRVDAVVAEFHPPQVDVAAMVRRIEAAGLTYHAPSSRYEMHSFIRHAASGEVPRE